MRTRNLKNLAGQTGLTGLTGLTSQTLKQNAPRRGSALLIVLGLLSFMMISAVSFAIYMRIERQASSNYRHSTTARHMLNAALYRAIDEIDSELRIPNSACKFPTNWPGRVRASAVEDKKENERKTRVLSMEALSFIPGILVNDVRYYANQSVGDWSGAKWRAFKDIGGNRVGRYAYICVNVSDMLDVNQCRASGRDSNSNRVSISHLVETAGTPQDINKLQAIDNKLNGDGKYLTLQDFYACQYNDPQIFDWESPYHTFAKDGTDKGFNEADNHVLITGSRVLPEPSSVATPPLNLQGLGPAGINDAFVTKLDAALPNVAIAGPGIDDMVTKMIKDYLDEDSVPSALNIPTVEMVPMISQIMIPPTLRPTIGIQPGLVDKTVCFLRLNRMPDAFLQSPQGAFIEVELVWPFKNAQLRTAKPKFDVEVEVYMKIINPHNNLQNTAPNYEVLFKGQAQAPDFWSQNIVTENDCYKKVQVFLTPEDLSKNQVVIYDSKSGFLNGFAENQAFSVALIAYAYVKQGPEYVDAVPTISPTYPPPNTTPKLFFPKLYFQTDPVFAQKTMSIPNDGLLYQWHSLEVPDPRFNHNAANWIKNNEADPFVAKMNQSTIDLLGKDGRDSDIFMFVANSKTFQSPGELGFIVRPFKPDLTGSQVDFSSHTEPEDAKHMLRTIRIYDHGGNGANERRDNIYDHFVLKNPDDTLSGARVNPLSDIPVVLEAAINKTPLDYWIAANRDKLPAPTPTQDYSFNTYLKQDWRDNTDNFVKSWSDALIQKARTKSISGSKTILNSWQVQIRDVYGLYDTMGWHTAGSNPTEIFNPPYTVTLPANKPLHEIDRKMLYSFSLDSFCDRQQLFLYFIRAEVTSPTLFGSITEARSLAGGRAVALVWRDPYPTGYNKDNDDWTGNKGLPDYDLDCDRVSPWKQYYLNEKPPRTPGTRRDSHHDHRIIFFKQLAK